jgi:Astacin (Peptidase family M12A)
MARRPRRSGTKPPKPSEHSGEFRGSPKMGVAVISGATFTNKSVVYYDLEGAAIVEGDICLGKVADVQKTMDAARDAVSADPAIAFSVGVTGSQFRWPNCQIPYEIDPALPNQQRVTDAIAHWESKTPFRFPLRTAANAGQFPNYVRFTDAGGCWSQVGMQGGQQTISLGTGCTAGNAIHEIGHTVGLWHEQSREDRDLFVSIHWEHIQDGMAAQFNQHITDGDDLGGYDYGSIMHYPRNAFTKDGQDTITPNDPNAQIGQRTGLSDGDLAGVRAMYPNCAWPSGIPKKLRDDVVPAKKLRDDGGNKKLRDDVVPVKKLRDDGGGPKKLRDDVVPPKKLVDDQRFKKITDDNVIPKPVIDPGKPGFDPLPGPGPLIPGRPVAGGGLAPFSLATPHHAAQVAAGQPQGMDPASAAYLSTLNQQMLDIEAALAQARATAAQANAEAARLQDASSTVAAALQDAMDQLGGGS